MGLRQKEVATALQSTEHSVGRWERGVVQLPVLAFYTLAELAIAEAERRTQAETRLKSLVAGERPTTGPIDFRHTAGFSATSAEDAYLKAINDPAIPSFHRRLSALRWTEQERRASARDLIRVRALLSRAATEARFRGLPSGHLTALPSQDKGARTVSAALWIAKLGLEAAILWLIDEPVHGHFDRALNVILGGRNTDDRTYERLAFLQVVHDTLAKPGHFGPRARAQLLVGTLTEWFGPAFRLLSTEKVDSRLVRTYKDLAELGVTQMSGFHRRDARPQVMTAVVRLSVALIWEAHGLGGELWLRMPWDPLPGQRGRGSVTRESLHDAMQAAAARYESFDPWTTHDDDDDEDARHDPGAEDDSDADLDGVEEYRDGFDPERV
jgi:hypothetical protein